MNKKIQGANSNSIIFKIFIKDNHLQLLPKKKEVEKK
jgi:hypothetical protein